MCEIVNNVYAEEDIHDALTNIQEQIYFRMHNIDYKYYRVIINEISEEEYLKEEDVQ
jgi:hypothetical protein